MPICGSVAEPRRARLIERTKAGLERARREGKRLGRPPASSVLLHAAADRVGRGEAARAVARDLGLSDRTLRRFMSARTGAAKAPRAKNRREGQVSAT